MMTRILAFEISLKTVYSRFVGHLISSAMPCGSYIRTNSERRCCFETDRPSLSYEQLRTAAFIGLVREMAGLTTKEDVTAELQPSRVRRDRRDLNKVMEHIKKSRNPFQIADSAQKILVNLNTGKAASQAVRDCLLNVQRTSQ